MPVKGMNQARGRFKSIMSGISDKKAKAALTKAIIYGAGASKEIAPKEFGNLINSQFRKIEKTATGYRGIVGYAVSYAAALEDPKPGGKLDGWQPRPPEQKDGNAWNPIASQGFLRLGFTGLESGPAIRKILVNGMRLK
ncbi:neck protein [Vibrio phage 1.210.O._10N.222.52.C2]|nr:neck protein [Vibrio phage 1.210.O._10N.222.52.C2]